jgi:ferritin-like protein
MVINNNMKPKIFISGKITGLEPEESKKLFKKAENYLKKRLDMFEVINPHEIKYESDEPAKQMLQILDIISQCEAVYFLDNWKSSNGSQCEYWFAKMLGIETIVQGS